VGANPRPLLVGQGCPGRHGEPIAASAHEDADRLHPGEGLPQVHLELLQERFCILPKGANIREGDQ
jgi:hypothetical protein